jgi:hypothetical protein
LVSSPKYQTVPSLSWAYQSGVLGQLALYEQLVLDDRGGDPFDLLGVVGDGDELHGGVAAALSLYL